MGRVDRRHGGGDRSCDGVARRCDGGDRRRERGDRRRDRAGDLSLDHERRGRLRGGAQDRRGQELSRLQSFDAQTAADRLLDEPGFATISPPPLSYGPGARFAEIRQPLTKKHPCTYQHPCTPALREIRSRNKQRRPDGARSEAPICSTPKFKRWRQLPASPERYLSRRSSGSGRGRLPENSAASCRCDDACRPLTS